MTFVRSLTGLTPPARYDELPYVSAGIEELQASGWAHLETVTFDDVDEDPTEPAARNFTTTLATLERAVYRVVWTDAAGHTDFTVDDGPARGRLARLVDAACAPTLSSFELDELLADARRRDRCGRRPLDPEWEPTYDFTSAAAAGWLRKAGAAAPATDFQTPRLTNYRSQLHTHCLAMHGRFRRQLRGSAHVVSSTRAAEEACRLIDLEDPCS